MESSFKDPVKAKKVYTKCVKRTLAQGTTTASYYGTIHVPATNILADVCLELGQRAYIGKVSDTDRVFLIIGVHEPFISRILP
jgi:guanine deaminase